ncbi:MAG TPA: M56 family metallopeptidase [Bryobacteraceae bacterium]|jgi:beta-lactamase regulating signal transducer with metallopeptidase domain|nr:M56 family metallopeptidase [Bryobacteraceae bacterium]
MITLLNQPWTERLGWTLLHFLWQGILLAALYALARALAGGRISARGRYTLACASLLTMAVAPALTYWWLGNSGQAARIGDLTDWGARQLTPAVAYSPLTDPWQQAMPAIVMVWFAGAAVCSLRLLMGFISAATLRRSPHVPVLTEWQQTLDRLIERMHVSRSVRLVATDRVDSPAVIGWIRPVILAPVGLLCGLAPEQVEALLAHELAHVRRHDYLVNVLQGIAESLLFYHPAVWWISSQIRAEREHCCDDLAVAASGDVLVYARALAELESMRPAHFKAALSANDGSLLRRIRRLTNPVAAHRPAGWGAAWSLGAVLLLAIAGVSVTGAQGQSQPVVKLETVWADTVKQGDMKLEVRGLGRLTSDHTAALKVAETQMQEVRQGKPAILAFRNRKETVRGKVAVVHPEVANGTMTVDVVIDDALPPGINLQEPVDGVITLGALTNVVYVGRPVFGRPNSQVMLFKIEPDGHSAKKVPVQFGATSVQLIEIKSGLKLGDKVIISDMSQYDGVAAIVLR